MCGVACPGSVIAVGCTCHAPRLVVSILTNRNETVSVLADSPATTVVTRRDRDAAVDPQPARIAKCAMRILHRPSARRCLSPYLSRNLSETFPANWQPPWIPPEKSPSNRTTRPRRSSLDTFQRDDEVSEPGTHRSMG